MTASSPIVSPTADNIVAVLNAVDIEAGPERIYPTFRNARTNREFQEFFIEPTSNTIHSWMVHYVGELSRREDEAGDLYWIKDRYEVHLYYGPFNDGDQTNLIFADILKKAADAITADRTIFALPDMDERTVGSASTEEVDFFGFLTHHGTFPMIITATQFQVAS